MSYAAAARVTDPFGHSEALGGALEGMLLGAMIGVALGVLVVATAGVGAPLAIAVGGAIAAAGGGGLMGEAIGQTVHGPASGVLSIGSVNVYINGLPATMVAESFGNCSQHGPAHPVASGVSSVLVNGQPIARVGSQLNCAATIMSGSPNVLIGGVTTQVLPISAEVPGWLHNTMFAMMVGGALVATAGAAAVYGAAVAVGGLVGGVAGGVVGGIGGRYAAAALGYGAEGQAIGGAIGGVVGGGLGGFAGGGIGAGFAGAGEDGAVEGGVGGTVDNLESTNGESFPGQSYTGDGGEPPTSETQNSSWDYQPKKIGQTEDGAVTSTPELSAQMSGAENRPSMSAEGYPDLPYQAARTFGDTPQPWDGNTESGLISRIIGQPSDANGSFWSQGLPPSSEAQWRASSAVLNDWNGDGGYVTADPAGMKGWIGPAAPQISSDGVSVLPGQGVQIWVPRGSATPSMPLPTPWNKGG